MSQPASVIELIETSLNNNWELPAFTDYGKNTLSFGEVAGKIAYWHHIFDALNIGKGEKIAVLGKNSTNWGIIYLSAVSYGAVIVPILPDFQPENIQHILNHSESQLLFADSNLADKLDWDQLEELCAIYSLNDFELIHTGNKKTANNIRKAGKSFPGEPAAGSVRFGRFKSEDPLALIYTSGTTGFSKGALLPHRSLDSNIQYAHENMPLQPGDRILSFLPMAHAFACAFEFLFPFTRGCHITFLSKMPTPNILLKAFGEVKPRLIFFVPLILEKIYKKRLRPLLEKPAVSLLTKIRPIRNLLYRKIRKNLIDSFGGTFMEVVIGGAALNEEVQQFLMNIEFPFTVGYGMTECGPLISYISPKKYKLNCVGKIVDRMEVKIDSEDPLNEAGEILVRGDNVMLEYFKNETATRETIDKDGWLHTGDLGVIDNDNYIYIKGRSKNVIVGPSGQNIYPEEIESQVNNMPYILESIVIEKGDTLFLLVHPDIEATDEDNMEEEDIQARMEQNVKELNKQLPRFMRISDFKIYPEEFEKTPTRKIKRYLYTTQ